MRRRTGTSAPKWFKPSVLWGPDLFAYVVKTPYNTEYIEELKLLCDVPAKWDAELKAWLVDARDESLLKRLLEKHFGSYDFEEKPKNGAGSFQTYDPSKDDSAYRKFILLCGKDIITRVWKQSMIATHSDMTGGDDKTAAEINASWASIKRDLGW